MSHQGRDDEEGNEGKEEVGEVHPLASSDAFVESN
jgi:hypothetical protein